MLGSRERRGRPGARPSEGRRARRLGVAAAPAIAVAVMVGVFAPNVGAAPLPIGGLSEAVSATTFTPKQVPGANDWFCRPSAAHPRPVVLVHGTFENMGFNWAALSPMLKNAGYCVYALNYGDNAFSLDQRFGGLSDIAASARELQNFVNTVLFMTGNPKVDIVGHSQGGMMPNYYIKRLGGASKVNNFIGLAPSNHGTTLSGLTEFGKQIGLLDAVNLMGAMTTPGVFQQEVGSPFMKALFADGDTVPGPKYAVIVTKKDSVVTPYTNGFLSGANVKNITIQDQCPADNTGHVGLNFDSPTAQNVLNLLGPNVPNFKAACTGYGTGI